MTHLAFQPAGPKVELEADYVVVGSGAGGATAAVTLARGGARVVLVEAGPWRDPEDYPSSMYGTMRDMFEDFGATIAQGRAFWPVVQGALVGGSTVINSAIAVQTPADVFARWQAEHGVVAGCATQCGHSRELTREITRRGAAARSWPQQRLRDGSAQKLGSKPLLHATCAAARQCQCLQGCKRTATEHHVTFIPSCASAVARC